MEKVQDRIELLKQELVDLRMDLDTYDNNPHKRQEFIDSISLKSRELDALMNYLESIKDLCK